MLRVTLLTGFLFTTVAPAQKPNWSGDFTLTIRGEDKLDKPPIRASWKVDRVARGRIVLDRMFKGAGLARTENSRDTSRYETWVADSSQPAEIRVNDSGTFYGPFFNPKKIRLDTIEWTCPARSAPGAKGQVRSSILQFDYVKGTYTLEAPRIYTNCDTFTRREFVQGPPEWTGQPPLMLEKGMDPAFEVIHRLVAPAEWTRITGPFRAGQTEIVLSRKFPFEWPLQTESYRAPLDAELTLVLRKSE